MALLKPSSCAWLSGPDLFRFFRRSLRAGLLVAVLANTVAATRAAGPVVEESNAKAAFTFSFAKFVGWPKFLTDGGRSTFRLGILGRDPLEGAMEEVVGGKTLHGLPVEVVYGRHLSELADCDLLFITVSEALRLRQHLAGLSGLPVLTVSDVPGFVENGGMIGLRRENNRLCFEVNQPAIEQVGLVVSSRLLALARVVVGESAPGESQ